MKARLIKSSFDGWNHYYLKNENDDTIGTTKYPFLPEMVQMAKGKGIELQKLSLSNCQAIERGYDLDEIKRKLFNGFDGQPDSFTITAVEKTAEIIFEILGDKKFSGEQVMEAIDMARETENFNGLFPLKYTPSSIIQSLQQTEWDVEIVQEQGEDTFGNAELTWYNPKLDENGCLILKRVENA